MCSVSLATGEDLTFCCRPGGLGFDVRSLKFEVNGGNADGAGWMNWRGYGFEVERLKLKV